MLLNKFLMNYLILVLPLQVFWFLHLLHPPVAGRGEAGVRAAANRLAVKKTRAAVARLQSAILCTWWIIMFF